MFQKNIKQKIYRHKLTILIGKWIVVVSAWHRWHDRSNEMFWLIVILFLLIESHRNRDSHFACCRCCCLYSRYKEFDAHWFFILLQFANNTQPNKSTELISRKFAFLFSYPIFLYWCLISYSIDCHVSVLCTMCLILLFRACYMFFSLRTLYWFWHGHLLCFFSRNRAAHARHFLLRRLCTVFLLIVAKTWIIICLIPCDAALHGSRSFPDPRLITVTKIVQLISFAIYLAIMFCVFCSECGAFEQISLVRFCFVFILLIVA